MSAAASPALLLPRSGALTAELLAPDAPVIEPSVVAEMRRHLRDSCTALVAGLAPEERIVLDGYRLKMALEDPEHCGQRDDAFVPSARVVRRAVGIAAVQRCLAARPPAPGPAVAAVLADGVAQVEEAGDGGPEDQAGRPPWWAKWYGSLPAGGRAVVAAEAVTWATHLWTALDWGMFEHPPVVGGRDDWWDCPGTKALTLHARVEVRATAGGRPVMVAVQGGSPGVHWRHLVGFPALVAGLARGDRALAGRVIGLWPASGQVRILHVDEAAVTSIASAVTGAVGALVQGRRQSRTA